MFEGPVPPPPASRPPGPAGSPSPWGAHPGAPAARDPFGDEPDGFVPPDPDEPPPVELWSAVGDVAPVGTVLLVLSWGLLFAGLALQGGLSDTAAFVAWGANATGFPRAETAWRLLASTFVHAGIAHVFFNALTMAMFGPAVERIFTRPGFAVVFAAGGAAASLASLGWRAAQSPAGFSISVGASGAIFALGGALLAAAVRLRSRLAPGRARALGAAILFLVGQGFVAGFTRHGTDNAAHAAGLAAGAVLGSMIPLSPRLGGSPRAAGLVRALGLLATLALLASLALAVRGGLGYRG